ncbi:MAG: HEAT repeat domain-containing protein [Anaerolineales bacterium]
MDRGFVELLESLGNEAQSIESSKLTELSDLDSLHLAEFREAWEGFGANRRHRILLALGDLANSKIELSFEAINRMALADPDPRSRAQAIANLWESEDPLLARQLLDELLTDPAAEVRRAAAVALGSFVLLAETQGLEQRLRLEIEQGLLEAIRSDPSLEVRDSCLGSLGYSTREEVPVLVEQAYASGQGSSLRAALRAMARSADSRWAELVLPKLQDPEPDIRLEAVQAAGELDMRQASDELVDLLEDVDDRIRKAAIRSLSQVGGSIATAALEQLQESASDSEAELIQDALENLAFEDEARDLFTLDFNDEDSSA